MFRINIFNIIFILFVKNENMIFFIYFRVLSQSEEHTGVMWALVFFLLEHAGDTPPDTEAPAVLELVLSLVMSPNISISLHQTLLQVRAKNCLLLQ